jgi:hypothetical protein
MDELINRYNNNILDRYCDLINSGKSIDNLNNNDLAKIFEYYSCIKLTQEYKQIFYEYDDIDNDFKELNNMSKNDTGIDACNLIDTIVQCKLRKNNLTWNECSTFFGSQNIYCEKQNKTVIKWDKLIITRNADSMLSNNLNIKNKMFNYKTFIK